VRLQAEVELYKAQVVKLKAENEQLHEHVAQNAALKERYAVDRPGNTGSSSS
jgi:hypothetical protein